MEKAFCIHTLSLWNGLRKLPLISPSSLGVPGWLFMLRFPGELWWMWKRSVRTAVTNEFQRNVRHCINIFQNSTEMSHTFGRLSMSPDPVEWGEKEKTFKYSLRGENVQMDGKICIHWHCAEAVKSVLPNEPFIWWGSMPAMLPIGPSAPEPKGNWKETYHEKTI